MKSLDDFKKSVYSKHQSALAHRRKLRRSITVAASLAACVAIVLVGFPLLSRLWEPSVIAPLPSGTEGQVTQTVQTSRPVSTTSSTGIAQQSVKTPSTAKGSPQSSDKPLSLQAPVRQVTVIEESAENRRLLYTDPDRVAAIVRYLENLALKRLDGTPASPGALIWRVAFLYDGGSASEWLLYEGGYMAAAGDWYEMNTDQAASLAAILDDLPPD